MPIEQIDICTADGNCPAYVMTPDGIGPWPAIVFYGDAGGIRPSMLSMATTLAKYGYCVLLPDLYYRFGPYAPLVPKDVFKGDVMAVLGPLMATTSVDKASRDTSAFLAHIDNRSDVVKDAFGAVGFCMGGGLAMASAATYPDRFGAVASFHGGNLATDAPTSPHLFAPRLTAELYIASADNDETYPPAMAERLEKALTSARVRFRAELYSGAAHGWMVPDFPTYDQASAERGWGTLDAMFKRILRD